MFSRLLSAIALIAIATCAVAQVEVPPLRGPVTDLTGTLTSSEATTLDSKLRAFEARKGSQVAVLIVPTTRPETLEEYSIRVAEAWKLGRRGINDGVLLLVAKDDRGVRIEVGYALEGALPDVIANRITDQVIVPRFRTGDYFGGINEAVDRIIAVIEGEPLPERPATADKRLPPSVKGVVPIMLMLIVVGGSILRRMFGSFGGAAATAGVAGFLIWILTTLIGAAIAAAVLAFVITLLMGGGGGGWISPRSGRRGGWGGGWGGGGFGGGGWGGGGGGGGWSGGGGSFGGGGASGRW